MPWIFVLPSMEQKNGGLQVFGKRGRTFFWRAPAAVSWYPAQPRACLNRGAPGGGLWVPNTTARAFESRRDKNGVEDPNQTRRFYFPLLPLWMDADSSAAPFCCVIRTSFPFGFDSNAAPFCCVIRTSWASLFRTIRGAALQVAVRRTRRF